MLAPRADPGYDVPVLGPIGIAATATTTVQTVLPPDVSRRGVIFCNAGTEVIRVAPLGTHFAAGQGGMTIYPQEELAIFADVDMRVNCGWQAVADSGTGTALTILNFSEIDTTLPAPARPPAPRGLLAYDIPLPPNAVSVSVGVISQQVIGRNPVRRGILFANPNAEPVLICVSPGNLAASPGAGSIGIAPGGEKRIVARGRIRVNCAWNAVSALVPNWGGSSLIPSINQLTIVEFL